jgi:hypothetical protein
MHNDDDDNDAGEMLDDVARIPPLVDRLRDLIVSATALDMKASARRYWSEEGDEAGPATISP